MVKKENVIGFSCDEGRQLLKKLEMNECKERERTILENINTSIRNGHVAKLI